MISWYTQVFVTLNWTFQTFLLRTSVIEPLEFKPLLAHGPALTTRDRRHVAWADLPQGRVRDAGRREQVTADNSEEARKVSD